MFTWFDLVQFFEHFPKYYQLILTLKMSAPRVIRFFIGVIPLFVGFAMFGVSFFSTYSVLFQDLGSAYVTLFALINGDVIHDVFVDLHPAGAYISRIYLYAFNSLFIYAVLNCFIAIVEDGFFAARETQRRDLKKLLVEREKDAADQDFHAIFNGPPVPMQYHTKQTKGSFQLSRENSDFGSSFLLDVSTAGQGNDSKEALVQKSPVSFNKSSVTLIPAGSRVSRKRVQNRRQLMQVLVTMQKSYNKEFLMVVKTIVNKSTVSVRPPHNPDHFPCDFDDCIYCVLKQVFKESLKDLETSIHVEVQELKRLHI